MVNELANRLRALRDSKKFSQVEVAKRARLSDKSYHRAEAGHSVHVNTLRDIIGVLKPDADDRVALWLAWIKLEIGEDQFREIIRHLEKESAPLILTASDVGKQLTEIASSLSRRDQDELIKAAKDTHVLACIRQLNAMRETLAKKK